MKKSGISHASSTFLDFLRITAASLVFIHHCVQLWYPKYLYVTEPVAHSAVVVFFVLSGYVIAHSTLSKDTNAKRFIIARLSRLYSVVIPALLLTAMLQSIGSILRPEFYLQYSRGFDGVRYLLTGFFLQNLWFFSASPPSNGPFWSLSYEFWYYVIFGIFVFVENRRIKYFALSLLFLIVGPNILLLMPCWLIGVGLYFSREFLIARLSKPRLIMALSFMLLLAIITFLPHIPYIGGQNWFKYSSSFLSDWAIALTVGAIILSFDALQLPSLPKLITSVIRDFSNHTFSLYLYHFPLLVFATALMPLHGFEIWQMTSIVVGIVFIILFLSYITESKRSSLQNAFVWIYDQFETKQLNGIKIGQ
jgi:peptidoglycan/LPS O-acetylase OafA/YrhL